MFKMKKLIAVLLIFAMIIAIGAVAATAEAVPEDAEVGAGSSTPSNIVIHVDSPDKVPYIYYWNALPANKECAYPGVKMSRLCVVHLFFRRYFKDQFPADRRYFRSLRTDQQGADAQRRRVVVQKRPFL